MCAIYCRVGLISSASLRCHTLEITYTTAWLCMLLSDNNIALICTISTSSHCYLGFYRLPLSSWICDLHTLKDLLSTLQMSGHKYESCLMVSGKLRCVSSSVWKLYFYTPYSQLLQCLRVYKIIKHVSLILPQINTKLKTLRKMPR